MATGLERIAVLIGCKSTSDERSAGKPHATIRGSCALKARGIQSFEIMTAVKRSRQPRTESCVMSGDGHCEGEAESLYALGRVYRGCFRGWYR